MKVDKETESQIQELQMIEQNLQSILMQKQSLQLELGEIENALKEIQTAGDDIYKITGQIMIKSSKKDIEKDLKEKQNIISLRIKTLDEQEKTISKTSEELRKKVLSKIKK